MTREGELPELTGVRLVTRVETPAPKVAMGCNAPRRPAAAVKRRRANLGRGYAETEVFLGSALEPGHEVRGPAIIEETFTTIVECGTEKPRGRAAD